MKLIQGSDGHFCAAKTTYMIAFALVAVKFAFANMSILGFEFGAFDSSGSTAFMGIAASIYFGRSHTKAAK